MFIYDKKETKFNHNGLAYVDEIINASVLNKLNGEYSLSIELLADNKASEFLIAENIIKTKTAEGMQLFRIKKVEKTLERINIYAVHIFYDLADNFLKDIYPQNMTADDFGKYLIQEAENKTPFFFESNISGRGTARYVRRNVVEALIGKIDNSMINVFGGEIERDNFKIKLKVRLGSDNGVKLLIGKNISGIKINIDTSKVSTRIIPIGFDGLLLSEVFVDSSKINNYQYPKIAKVEFPDIKWDKDGNNENAFKNKSDAQDALRQKAIDFFNAGGDEPEINISVDWIELAKTEEYKNFLNLEALNLGDTVHAKLLGIDYTTRVISTTYNVLTDMIEKFEIGNVLPSFTDTVLQVKEKVESIKPSEILQDAKNTASDLIKSANGGVVYKSNGELFIMDDPDPNKAKRVWRWNINGLGYSDTGINGTYGTAITMDGEIVADYIKAGKINTNLIEGYNDLNDTVARISTDLGEIKTQVINNINLTKEITSKGTFLVNKAIGQEALEIRLLGSKEIYNNIYTCNDTFPANSLYPGGLKNDIYN